MLQSRSRTVSIGLTGKLDLRGPPSLQGRKYELRRHTVPLRTAANTTLAHRQAQEQAQSPQGGLLRHHFFISGLDETCWPIMQKLNDPAKKQIRLLFGGGESLSTIAFNQGLLKHLANTDSDRLNAWHKGMADKQGVFSITRPELVESRKRSR